MQLLQPLGTDPFSPRRQRLLDSRIGGRDHAIGSTRQAYEPGTAIVGVRHPFDVARGFELCHQEARCLLGDSCLCGKIGYAIAALADASRDARLGHRDIGDARRDDGVIGLLLQSARGDEQQDAKTGFLTMGSHPARLDREPVQSDERVVDVMDSATIWQHIDAERAAVADILESLQEGDWDQASLCDGWTVRDVGAHLAFAQARVRDVLWPAIRTGFRYNAMIAFAAVHSPLTHEQIVATLRGFVGSRRRAPFISELEPLIDILVHTQDICLPLGINHPMPADAAAAAADRVLALRGPMRLWKAPEVRLVATDIEWARGEGEELRAPMQNHLLTLTGRRVD